MRASVKNMRVQMTVENKGKIVFFMVMQKEFSRTKHKGPRFPEHQDERVSEENALATSSKAS